MRPKLGTVALLVALTAGPSVVAHSSQAKVGTTPPNLPEIAAWMAKVDAQAPNGIVIWLSQRTPNGASAGVSLAHTEIYLGGPSALVPAESPTQSVTTLRFEIRAWREGEKSRVLISAVLRDDRAPTGFTSTPISTFTISPGQTIEVPETQGWGAAPVVVTAKIR